jgi:DNA-damage-inducible protein J
MAKTVVVHKRTVKPGVKRVKRARQAEGAVVRARISAALKTEAEVVLEAIGLDTSTAFRLMMTRIAEEKALPFELYRPTEATLAAIRELRAGGGKKFETFSAMMADLDADD